METFWALFGLFLVILGLAALYFVVAYFRTERKMDACLELIEEAFYAVRKLNESGLYKYKDFEDWIDKEYNNV